MPCDTQTLEKPTPLSPVLALLDWTRRSIGTLRNTARLAVMGGVTAVALSSSCAEDSDIWIPCVSGAANSGNFSWQRCLCANGEVVTYGEYRDDKTICDIIPGEGSGSASVGEASASMTMTTGADDTTSSSPDEETGFADGTSTDWEASSSGFQTESSTGETTGGPYCGDGNLDGSEQCDGESFPENFEDCASIGLGEGELACSKECALDLSDCTASDKEKEVFLRDFFDQRSQTNP